jgi:hypothetical protein
MSDSLTSYGNVHQDCYNISAEAGEILFGGGAFKVFEELSWHPLPTTFPASHLNQQFLEN